MADKNSTGTSGDSDISYTNSAPLASASPDTPAAAELYCDVETDAHNPVRGEMALWQAVITQALMDARGESKKTEAEHDKRLARIWLKGVGDDFADVCLYAGLTPEYVKLRAREALARGCRWRAEAGNGKARPGRKKPLTLTQEDAHDILA